MKTLRQSQSHNGRGVCALQGYFCCLSFAWGLTAAQPVQAEDTGAKVTTNVVNAGSNWSNFTVAKLNASDNSRATKGTNGDPAGTQIDGIKVDVEGRRR